MAADELRARLNALPYSSKWTPPTQHKTHQPSPSEWAFSGWGGGGGDDGNGRNQGFTSATVASVHSAIKSKLQSSIAWLQKRTPETFLLFDEFHLQLRTATAAYRHHDSKFHSLYEQWKREIMTMLGHAWHSHEKIPLVNVAAALYASLLSEAECVDQKSLYVTRGVGRCQAVAVGKLRSNKSSEVLPSRAQKPGNYLTAAAAERMLRGFRSLKMWALDGHHNKVNPGGGTDLTSEQLHQLLATRYALLADGKYEPYVPPSASVSSSASAGAEAPAVDGAGVEAASIASGSVNSELSDDTLLKMYSQRLALLQMHPASGKAHASDAVTKSSRQSKRAFMQELTASQLDELLPNPPTHTLNSQDLSSMEGRIDRLLKS